MPNRLAEMQISCVYPWTDLSRQ